MKVLTVMNEKGGVGKTNIVAHGGWYFADYFRTLVIDLDQQANLTTTMSADLGNTDSVELFSEVKRVEPIGDLTVTRATRELLSIDSANPEIIETFRNSLSAMSDDYDICIIDTPSALANRTYGALLVADAVIIPIGINNYSVAGIEELLRAMKGISTFYKRPEHQFLGLLPSIFDRKNRRERALFEVLEEQFGKILFPGVVSKRDFYSRTPGEKKPVWNMGGTSSQTVGNEIRSVFHLIGQKMKLR